MQENIGPYRIEEQLGVGGMGEVYKAYDDRLERWVAIKRIRTDKDEDEENRERFKREARATARLNHTSIVHVYDIFRDPADDCDCIVMEYVEGKTLDRLIRNGPLEPVQVAALGHEIAGGLAEAHAKGIIHRDLKVENIIITPAGRAKILDFGLARPLLSQELDSSLTGKGQLVGTSRAMSPEYVSGEEIDHRSDLFSLGVLLYESATSHSPFKAHNTLSTLKQVMLYRPTPAHQVNSNVPEELSDVIERLLEKDPIDRPQNAREVGDELGNISGQLSSGGIDRPSLISPFSTTPTEILTPSSTVVDVRTRRRWWLMIAALLVVGIATTYLVTRWWFDGSEQAAPGMVGDYPFQERDRIVLADFQNHTEEPLLDDSLELAFRLGLEQSRYASVLPQSRMQAALLRMQRDAETPIDRTLGIEICQREDAKALIVGSIGRIGETYSLSAEIIDPQTGEATFVTRENAEDQSAIVTALETVTNAVRINLGETLAVIEEGQRPLEKVTTSNLEALKVYSLGVAELDNELEAAIPLFEQALRRDPDFAMAYAKLATVYLDRYEHAKALEYLDEALRLSDRLTATEKLYVEGWAARLHGDAEEVLNAWTLMSSLYPEDVVGHLNLGMAQWEYLNQFGEAARAFSAAAKVAQPKHFSVVYLRLGYAQLALGKHDEARASFEKISASERQVPLVDLALVAGDSGRVRELLEAREPPVPGMDLQIRSRWVLYHVDRGSLDEALEEAREIIGLATERESVHLLLPSHLAVLALHERLADDAGLESALGASTEAALSLMSSQDRTTDTIQVRVAAHIGKLNARNAKLAEARSIHDAIDSIAAASGIVTWQAYAALLEAELLLAAGEHERSADLLEEVIAIADLSQAHESLARVYEESGRVSDAIQEQTWLSEHRSRGFVECLDACEGLSSMDWVMSFYHRARLHERLGEPEEAAERYRQFLELWPEAPDLPARVEAKTRLAALQQGV
ncbi:MAG: protein kinase [bacterium]|nr:protein kinase [bacterium]